MIRRLLLLLSIALPLPVAAQTTCPANYANVVISRLGALQALQNGTLIVSAVDAQGNPLNYSVPGVGIELLTPKKDPVVAGQLANTLCLARSDRTSVPVGYHFTAIDTSPTGGNRKVLDVNGVAILSDTFDLDTYSFQQANAYALQNLLFSGLLGSLQTPGGTLDGTNKTFSLTGSPTSGLLYRNGVLQQPGIDYSLNSNGASLTFNIPPSAGDVLLFIAINLSSSSSTGTPGSFGALTGSPYDNTALNNVINTIEAGKAAFSQLAGAPTDNAPLAAALNGKASSTAAITINNVSCVLSGTCNVPFSASFASLTGSPTDNSTLASILAGKAASNASITINGTLCQLNGSCSPSGTNSTYSTTTSFAAITGQPTDNTNLAAALTGKASASAVTTINNVPCTISGSCTIPVGTSGSSSFSSLTGQPTDNSNLAVALAGKAAASAAISINNVSCTLSGSCTIPVGTGGSTAFSSLTGQPTDNANLATALSGKAANGASFSVNNVPCALGANCTIPTGGGGSGSASAPSSYGLLQGDNTGGIGSTFASQEFQRTANPELQTWRQALSNCASQVVGITAITDSRGVAWQGDTSNEGPTNWADLYNYRILNQAVANGCALHSYGWTPFVKFLVPGSPNPNNLFYAQVSGFDKGSSYDSSYGPVQNNSYNGSVWSPVALFNGGGFDFTNSAVGGQWDTVQALCESGPSYGTLTFNVQNSSGASLATFTCGGNSSSIKAVKASSVTFAASAGINVQTSCSGTCRLYAMKGSLGTVGVDLNLIGEASASTSMYASSTAFAFIDLMDPVHLVTIDLGTNDPLLGNSTSTYASYLTTIVQHMKAQSTSPSVLQVFPPMSTNFSSYALHQSYSVAALGVARNLGDGFVDISHSWGGTTVTNLFVDNVHPNTQGNRLEFNQIAGQLFDPVTLQNGGTSGGSGTSGSSNYNPASVAITGGDVSGVTLGGTSGIKSLSLSNPGATGNLIVAQIQTNNGASYTKFNSQGDVLSTGNHSFNAWLPVATTNLAGSACAPNGAIAPSQYGSGYVYACVNGTWGALGSGGSTSGSGASNYDPSNVAITGGDISGVTLGANQSLKSMSVVNGAATGAAQIAVIGGANGTFGVDASGRVSFPSWLAQGNTNLIGAACAPNGSLAPTQYGTGSLYQCISGKWAAFPTNYDPTAVAITGGSVDGVALGANSAIKSLSVSAPSATGSTAIGIIQGNNGASSSKFTGDGSIISTGNHTYTVWLPVSNSNLQGSGCGPNGAAATSSYGNGAMFLCVSGTWHAVTTN